MADQDIRSFRVRSIGRVLPIAALALAVTAGIAGSARAASPVALGTAESFAVLAGSTITNTGPTTITGDIGLCCTGISTPGFDSVIQPGGAQYRGTGTPAEMAQADLDVAYANAAGQAVSETVGVDLSLSGTPADPLLPGVYQSTGRGAFQINTGLTLDFGGDPNAVFIFQGTSVTAAAGANGSVRIVNGGSAPSTCNVVWQLSDATQGVTLEPGSAFKGTTLALGASVLKTGATVEGRILTRREKAVTLDTNTITRPACSTGGGDDGGGGGDTTTPPPAGTGTPAAAPTAAPAPAAAPPAFPVAPVPPVRAALPPRGAAQLWGPSGPVRGPFTVFVTGREIAQVTFYVDGRRVGAVRASPGREIFRLKVNPRGRRGQVTARVRFKTSSRTPSRTRRVTYQRSTRAAATPSFTG